MKRFNEYIRESSMDLWALSQFIENLPHEEPWSSAYHDLLVKSGLGQVIPNSGNDDRWTTDIGVPKLNPEGKPLLDPNDPDSGVPWWEHPAYQNEI